jgi:hypothetical protein
VTVGQEWRLTWWMWPPETLVGGHHEAFHFDEWPARGQYDGLRSMQAPDSCQAKQGVGPCAVHVWDVRFERRHTNAGEWETIG